MDESSTDALRKLAPCWSLAGDEQLFSILQNTHQRLLSKCQEANSQLEQMATALNDASVSLQNVNNQFMALSNSQFIETRVYDDDDLAAEVPVVKEPPKPEVPDELTSLKRSISVLENAHEIITILQDSDTESDSDDEMPARLVLKPKDMYASRPLPHIIGTQPWKNKWHAGLLLEDSDSDSTASKVEHDSDQYSQSEPEDTHTDKLPVPHTHTTVSESSSELPSEQGSVPKPTPSDVASEIARRLGAREPPKMLERDPEDEEPPKPSVRKIYRPQDPVSSTIFPDEPPPLSDHSDSQESDIFADLHRSQPFARTNVADELFGGNENNIDSDEGDIFSDFANKPSTKPTSLFDSGPTPHMFVKQNESHHRPDDYNPKEQRNSHDNNGSHHIAVNDDRVRRNVQANDGNADARARGDDDAGKGVKKPIGGISLFGNKGTESIGAAILNRNKRKSSTSDDDSGSDSRSESQPNQQIRKEKDIFDDLFARSDSKKATKKKDLITEIKKKSEEKIKDKNIEKPKVDLFSDNLFDDIDDIFTTNVVKMPTDNAKSKSIFEDDDDLFSEIAAPKPMRIEVASSSNNKKSLFDSDDELFSDNVAQAKPGAKPKEMPKTVEVSKPKVAIKSKLNEDSKLTKDVTKSIFDDDEDELFSDVKTNKLDVNKVQDCPVSIEKPNDFGKSDENILKNIPKATTSNLFKSPSLFDDDDDENDLFAEPAQSSNVQSAAAPVKLSSKTDVKIPEGNFDVKPSSSIKPDNTEQIIRDRDSNDLNKDKNTETNVHSVKDENPSLVPVSENIDSRKPISNTNVETNAAKIFDHIHKKLQNIEQSSSDTNNDESDQDFDDLPPKQEKNKNINIKNNIVIKTDEIPKEKHNIFDKTTLEEDIDELFATKQQTTDNTETIFKDSEPDFTETLPKDSNKTEKDNKKKETTTKDIETDIFSNILTEPPVFEKPKEPKRSKNVNALFDDDSDDESLFFKKNDPIFVENPEDFTPTQDRIFGLFTDEPPDDDFSKVNDDFDDDMFSTLPKPRNPQNEDLPPLPNTFKSSLLDNTIPDIEKTVSIEEIFTDLPKDEVKPDVGITKEPSLDIEENIFELPTTDNKNKSLNDATVMSDEEELFKTPVSKSKPSLKERPSPDLISDDENLFTTVPKKLDQEKLVLGAEILESVSKSSDDELFSTNRQQPSLLENKVQNSKSDEDLFKTPVAKPEFIPRTTEMTPSDPKPEKSEKKVGKLKVGLNINVNALLPGASPKKVKPSDQPDGQSQSVAESQKPEPRTHSEPKPKEPEDQNADSKLLKSVSFDGKPESGVLDNKLSKERAKIQVKRRPSTRRARREAVRKSGIDFGEDSTDNSSSIDDPPRKQPGPKKEANPNETRQTEVQAKPEETTEQAEIHPTAVETQPKIEPVTTEPHPETTEKPTYSKDVKSKIVYILNDEDIFNTDPTKQTESLDKVISENLDANAGVTTLGKVYDTAVNLNERSSKNDQKSSLFGDDNDEKIFQAKTVVKKATIFDSDSEEDLFGTCKKEEKRVDRVEVKKEINREVVKGSLFGDEDDDDDLFGDKTKKIVDQKPQPSRSTAKETPKPAEPVFEDPLSMFGDED